LQSIEKLNESYRGLFDVEIGNDEQRSESNNVGGDGGFTEHWGWIVTLDNLCNGDFTKRPFYEKMNVIEFLNICAFVKDKQRFEERQLRIAQLKNGVN